MSQYTPMTSLVEDYLEHRRRLGFALVAERSVLMNFAHYAEQSAHQGPVTLDLAVRWARSSSRNSPLSWGRRLEVLRGFTKYCAQFDSDTEIPPPRLFGSVHRRLLPHIYSDKEIQSLLEAALRLPPLSGLRPITCNTVFGLLAATGMRVSEATHLSCGDVDLDQGLLTVRETKFRKSRLLPLHPTTTGALCRYVKVRDQMVAAADTNAFFLFDGGQSVNTRQIQYAFCCLRPRLGWKARGDHPQPRLHDLRHSFICHRLIGWYEAGIDIDNAILALSTYVGHAKVSDTYWYITGTPELMAIAAQRFECFAQGGKS